MKKILFLVAISLTVSSFAQVKKDTVTADYEKQKSSTVSSLVTAQAQAYRAVFDSVYLVNKNINADKIYANEIAKKTAECLITDITLWGKSVIADALNGKFKRYRLSFDKPDNNTFKVPAKAKRNYKKAFKKVRRDFIATRKSKTLNEIFSDKYLKKFLEKTNKAFIHQKDKHLRKISK